MALSRSWSGGCVAEIELRFRFSARLFLSLLILQSSVFALLVLMLEPIHVLVSAAPLVLSLMACARLPCVGWSRHVPILASAHDDGSWSLVERGGRILEGRLLAGRVFGSSLVFVRWQTNRRRVTAVLFPDSCEAAALRRLRACLLAGHGLGSGPEAAA